MKVLLIAPPIMDVIDGELRVVGVDALRECPPLGIYGLAAVLESQGHEAVVVDLILQGSPSLGAFEKGLDTSDLVGVGSTSMAWPTAADVIEQVRRRRPDVPIVCGGVHPTLFDRYVLNAFPVQFVVRGEGETAIGRLCSALERQPGPERGAEPVLGQSGGTARTQSDRSEAAAQRTGMSRH